MTIRVLLADDHTLFRAGLRALLHTTADIRVIGEVGTGREAIPQALALEPDVVIMDVAMPDLNGIEAAREIRAKRPRTRILMLSMHSTGEHVHRAFAAGVRGYLLKEAAGEDLVRAVRAVHGGELFLCDGLREAVGGPDRLEAPKSPLERLSARERQVLQLLVEGRRTADIAESLGVSPKTVETYRYRLMEKLGVEDLPALVKFAIEHGLTPPA